MKTQSSIGLFTSLANKKKINSKLLLQRQVRTHHTSCHSDPMLRIVLGTLLLTDEATIKHLIHQDLNLAEETERNWVSCLGTSFTQVALRKHTDKVLSLQPRQDDCATSGYKQPAEMNENMSSFTHK